MQGSKNMGLLSSQYAGTTLQVQLELLETLFPGEHYRQQDTFS